MSFGIRFDFSYGRCTLQMGGDGGSHSWRAYHLHRSFEQLLTALRRIIENEDRSTCARWGSGELAGGVFLDFVADPGGGVNIAVHSFMYDERATEYNEMWSAERGPLLYATRVSMREFVPAVADAVRRVRTLYVDHTGYIEQWGWSFPSADAERIERVSENAGNMPKSTKELRIEQQQSVGD